MIILGELVTLKENKDFRRLYSRGRSYSSSVLVTYVMKNRTRNVRIGITTSKKIGKAVMRNRSRRIIREAYFQLADEIKPGYDLVFVARGKTPFVKSTDILRAMRKELKEAGVLK
ncbi:MAG: ribonuclease P protein component [Clostridia bacterium]|nr:ribonuclease P protein component [Clostridia bacterium]